MQGADVFLAMDLPDRVQLSAAGAPGLIRRGDLVIEVRNPITDAQLDSLGAQLDTNSDQDYLSGDGRVKKSLDMHMTAGLRRSMASNSESDTEKVYSDTLHQYSQSNKASSCRRRSYDSASDSEDELEEDSVMNHYRQSLSSTLVGLDDMKGLTDDELDTKMTHLKSSMEGLPPKVSRNLSGYRGAVPGMVSAAIDSGSEDYSASDNDTNSFRVRRNSSDVAGGGQMRKEKSLRLAPEGLAAMKSSFGSTVGGPLEGIGLRRQGADSRDRDRDRDTSERRLFSSSLTLSRSGGGRVRGGRQLRDYDSQEDGDDDGDSGPVGSSQGIARDSSNSHSAPRISPQTRYSSTRDSEDEDEDEEGADRLAQEYLQQYERESQEGGGGGLNSSLLSTGTAEEKRDYLASRDEQRELRRESKEGRGRVDQDQGQDQEPEDFNDTSSMGSATQQQQQRRLSPSDLQGADDDLGDNHSTRRTAFSSTGESFSALSQQTFATDDSEDSEGKGGGRGARALLSTTVDTDISMPGGGDNDSFTHSSFDREDSVNKRADQYERDVDRDSRDVPASSSKPPLDSSSATGGGVHTPQTSAARRNGGGSNPQQQQQSLYSSKTSTDTSSPFDHLTSDFDEDNDVDVLEGSLDLSQSADAFGAGTNLDLSSFSKNR